MNAVEKNCREITSSNVNTDYKFDGHMVLYLGAQNRLNLHHPLPVAFVHTRSFLLVRTRGLSSYRTRHFATPTGSKHYTHKPLNLPTD